VYIFPSQNMLLRICTRLRSYLGYPVVRDALPNTTHFALAALQYSSYISRMITQVCLEVNENSWLKLTTTEERRWAPSEGTMAGSEPSKSITSARGHSGAPWHPPRMFFHPLRGNSTRTFNIACALQQRACCGPEHFPGQAFCGESPMARVCFGC